MMYFQSWRDFFSMGGYGFYVWLAYGLSFATLIILFLMNYRNQKQLLRQVRYQQQRELRLQQIKSQQAKDCQ